jgi:superfamily II DNA or RNA helicase
MEVGFDPVQDEEREKARKANKKYDIASPLDVLLSSNMISVGVDVQRLGLMVVAGQPKTTAEYIQATSRVGRGSPGLICTVFNWARPRDLSHYEMFGHYHATFYRHVEALSVTPFASRALDRGLSAMLVSLVRLGQFEMNENRKAQQLDRSRPYISAAVDRISKRGQAVTGKWDIGKAVEQALKYRLDEWETRAKRRDAGSHLGYETEKDGVTIGLLKDAGLGPWDLYTCLNSLRDVEPSVSLILSDKELD